MKRLLIILGATLAVLALLLAVAWFWLTGTRSGAAFALARAEAALPGFSYQHVEGGLDDGIVLANVEFEQQGLLLRASRIELAARIRPLRRAVVVDRLLLDDVYVQLPPSADEAESAPIKLGDYRLPVLIDINDLQLAGFVLVDDQQQQMLALTRVELAGSVQDELAIRRFALQMDDLEAGLSGSLGLASPWPVALELNGDVALDADTRQQLTLRANGPLETLDLDVNAVGPAAITGTASVRGLPDIEALTASANLTGGLNDWPGVEGRVDDLSLAFNGSLDDWQLEAGSMLNRADLPSARVTASATGSAERIEVDSLRIETLDGAIEAQAEALLNDPLTAQATLNINGLNPTALVAEWPVGVRLAGSLEADWNGTRLRLSSLQLQAPPTALSVDGSAEWSMDTQALGVDLGWESLAWPPVVDAESSVQPLFSSRSGTLRATGTLDEWRAELDAWLDVAEQQQGQIKLDATGDAVGFDVNVGQLDFGSLGQAALTGRVDYAETPSLALDVMLKQFDPAVFVNQLPGRVDAEIALMAELGDPLSARMEIKQLGGQMRQVPLDGSGSVAVIGDQIQQGRLELGLGANQLTLDSRAGEPWSLRLEAGQLNQLWPELTGGMVLQADIDASLQRAEWTIDGAQLGWQGARVAEVTGRGEAGWGDSPVIDAMLTATDVDLNPWERLSRVELDVSGDCAAHELDLEVDGQRLDVELVLAGALEGCIQNPARWTGAMSELAFSNETWGRWQLEQPLPIMASAETVQAGPGCLWIEGDPGRLCLTEFENAAEGHAQIALNALPMDLLLLVTDPVFTISSEIKGLARVHWGPGGVRSVDSTLAISPGGMRMLRDEEVLLNIRGARLDTRSPNPGMLSANLELALEEQSLITARADIPDLNAPQGLMLESRIDLDLPSLAAFNRFAPQFDEFAGSLAAQLELAGPLDALDYSGEIAVRNGHMSYAQLGMDLAEIELTVELQPGRGTLDGSFLAGEGRAQIRGSVQQGDTGWSGDAEIDGNTLRLFDVDWLKLTASSDLALAFTPQQLMLDGGLVIDSARLGLPPGSETRVAVSPDAVIVGAAEEPEESVPAAAQVLSGQIRLEMGDDVKLAAAGMETKLRGALDITWPEDSAMPRGRGTIRLVDGSYRAYGQSLEVTEGDVMFTDHPIDNPVLQIEAVREIFGDAQVDFAGVRILGPAQRPDISLFTDPPTTSEKALTYILTGADFDHAGGQGAFNVGFWVLPKLFVSYGVGLFDTGNVLAARYELSRRWGLRATSGERDTGVDVSFIIDR